jgi:hypothetical protein
MPNSEILIYHHFKYDTALSDMSFVQSLPSKWVVLAIPVQAIDAPKHPGNHFLAFCAKILAVSCSFGAHK